MLAHERASAFLAPAMACAYSDDRRFHGFSVGGCKLGSLGQRSTLRHMCHDCWLAAMLVRGGVAGQCDRPT